MAMRPTAMATSAAFLAHCAAVAVVAVATTSSHDVLRGVRLPANRTPTQLRAQSCESCGGQLLSRFGFEAGYINFNHGSYVRPSPSQAAAGLRRHR